MNLVGGKDNINDVYHCQTRLRFKLVDELKVEEDKLEELDGVATAIKNAGVYQIVIGTHVKDVFDEVADIVNLEDKKPQTNSTKREKRNCKYNH